MVVNLTFRHLPAKSLPMPFWHLYPAVRHKLPFVSLQYFSSAMRQIPVFKEENKTISRCGISSH
jgi:hypothetical protein